MLENLVRKYTSESRAFYPERAEKREYGEIEERGDASQRHEDVQRKLHQSMVLGDFEKRAGGGERRRPHDGEDVSIVHPGAAVRAVLEELGRVRDELLLLGNVRLPNDVHPLLVSQLVVCGLCVRRETLRYDGARENLLARDGLVDVDQELVGQVLAVIHFSVVFVQLDEVFQLHAALWLHVRVVQIRVQHDDREADAVRHVRVYQNVVIDGLLISVPREGLHNQRQKRKRPP